MKATQVTGHATPLDRSWERASAPVCTIRVGDDGALVMVDAEGIDMGDPWEYLWKGLRSFRGLQRHLIGSDGRRTAKAVSMFEPEQRHFTKANGDLEGAWMGFAAFALHMTTRSAEDFGTVTYEDKARWFEQMVTQETW